MPFDVFDRLLRPLRRGPVTSGYPDWPLMLPTAARGLPVLDPARCDGTAACVDVCPTGAIHLDATIWTLDAGRCIFCAACARVCPRDAIALGGIVELAAPDRADLVIRTPRRSEP
jgi:formate hydrogenlyase subunit 6/NADH:ubiquinone oxidoreductase subunit I